ncbi:MAG: hypothetical protein WC758_03550 [Candidatus Woesearchaeota archaeon]|jgi:hypothetical protein
MKDMHLLLDEAEYEWRSEVHKDFPLHSDTPVIKSKPKTIGRDWEFSTDLKQIYAFVENDDALKKKFETIVTKYWNGNSEDLAKDTLHYLLDHELYHVIEAPFSIGTPDSDNTKIHQAIRKGLLKAEPNLKPLDQLVKLEASQNGVKDFILDNRFYLDNKTKRYVQEDIIPVWDLLELQNSKSETNFYTITRFLYGALYGPQSTHSFFQEKAGEKGFEIAEKTLKSLINKEVSLPKNDLSLIGKVSKILKNNSTTENSELTNSYAKSIREVFSGEDRYKGIERMMTILGPYIKKDMPQGRPDQQGEGSGASPQNMVQDILNDMTPQEQAQFIEQLSSDPRLSQDFSMGKPNSTNGSSKSNEEYNTLDIFAIHEFYKRNHPSVKIIGGNKIGETIVVDNKQYWHLKKSEVISEDQLSKINLKHVAKFQQKIRLPVLIPLGNNQYRLNDYEIRTRDIKNITYVDSQVDVPDIVEFYLDSSGSMYKDANNFGFNDGSSWDMLSNVLYGYIDALHQGGQATHKKTMLRINNFGDKQKSSKLVSIDEFLKGDTEVLKVLFKPANGYSEEDINLQSYNDNLKRAYVIVTDGNLVISGRTERESKKMKELAKNPNNKVLMFEIGGTYGLGTAIKNDTNINYAPIYDKNKMLSEGISVLLSK